MKFMQRYGYLGGDPSSGFEAQYTEESVVNAITNIQKYGGLQETGIFDNKTIEVYTFYSDTLCVQKICEL